MSIDFGQVDWLYVVVLVFAAIFVFWTYYPHGLPLPTSITGQKSPVTAVVPAAPTTPQRPHNPVTDITAPPNTSQ